MNYSLQTAIFNQKLSRDFSDTVIEQMQYESDYIVAALEGLEYISEAVDAASKGSIKGTFDRIIAFIKSIFAAFTEKVKVLVGGNKVWLEKNKDVLARINYDGLQIEMIPFWSNNLTEKANALRGLIDKVIDSNLSAVKDPRYKDIEEVKKLAFKTYLNEDGDLSQGAKNYFRTGDATNKGSRPVSLGGANLKAQVQKDFHPYCTNYNTATFAAVKSVMDTVTRKTEFISKTAERKSTELKENFTSFDTGTFKTVRSILSPVFEAGEATPEAKPAGSTPTNNTTPPASATKVTLQNNANDASSAANNKVSNMGADESAILKNYAQCVQTVAAALLTVAEERYTAYMNAMKQIVSARAPKEAAAEPDAKVTDTKTK